MEVSRNGTFSQRLQQTKQNLIRTINQSGNLGKHFIRAVAAPTEETYDQNVPLPPNMLAANAILLANDRFLIDPDALPSTVTDFKYPVIEPVTVSFNSSETTLTQESVLPLATTSSASATGDVYFNHGRYLGKNRSDQVRIRMIGYDSDGNAWLIPPQYFLSSKIQMDQMFRCPIQMGGRPPSGCQMWMVKRRNSRFRNY